MKCHADVNRSQVFKLIPIEFSVRPERDMDGTERPGVMSQCSYCGSIGIEEVLKTFQTKGVEWSGTDWKHGWPHKFYLEVPCEPYRRCVSGKTVDGKTTYTYGTVAKNHFKFYTEHLLDATDEQIGRWNTIVSPLTGIRFELINNQLKFQAPRHGHQAAGTIQ